jgi:hypothetical protein
MRWLKEQQGWHREEKASRPLGERLSIFAGGLKCKQCHGDGPRRAKDGFDYLNLNFCTLTIN